MSIILDPLITVLHLAISFYIWLVIGAAIMSWLVAFNVLNTYNRLVYTINDFLYRITEPALRPIRRFLPTLGGIDISPVVLILILVFLQRFLERIYPAVVS